MVHQGVLRDPETLTYSAADFLVRSDILIDLFPGHPIVTVTPASGSFTNDLRILECRTRAGNHLRLVVKFMVDQPEYSS